MNVKLPVRRAILERKTYEAPAEGRFGKLRLDFNENTAGCSPAVRRALARLSAKEIAMYPEYLPATKTLAKYFGVKTEEFLLTNGGDDALRVFFDTFVEPQTSILICEPTFPMYRYYAEIAGAQILVCRYGAQMEFPLQPVLNALAENPRVLFIANPNNPTGTLLPLKDIERIAESASNTAVVIDEAYADFSGVTAIALTRRYPHLFVARTFSKAAGLAGLRLGAVIGCAESMEIVRRAMPPYPVNLAALVSAVAAVRDRATIRKYVSDIKRIRTWFASELRKIGAATFPSTGNFLLANFGPHGPELFAKLEKCGILLRERTKSIGPGFVRITIGTESEMRRLLREIRSSGWSADA